MAPRILNLGEWREHILHRLERHLRLTGDPAIGALLEELAGYSAPAGGGKPPAHDVFVPLRMRGPGEGELSLFGTIATFGTAVDVTAGELSIESFFPADATTAEALIAAGEHR